jgi:hypothetical protein
MSRKKSKKDKREKAFSGYRGYPLIPPNKTHNRKRGPYDRRKELKEFLKDIEEEICKI